MNMKIDIGAAVSLISQSKQETIFPDVVLRESNILLKMYTGEQMRVQGEMDVVVQYENQQQPLVLLVVSGDGPNLFGKNWLHYIQLNWRQLGVARVKKMAVGSIEDLQARYSNCLQRN